MTMLHMARVPLNVAGNNGERLKTAFLTTRSSPY